MGPSTSIVDSWPLSAYCVPLVAVSDSPVAETLTPWTVTVVASAAAPISTVPIPSEVSVLLMVPPLVAESAMSPVAWSVAGRVSEGTAVALPTVTLVSRDSVSLLPSALRRFRPG